VLSLNRVANEWIFLLSVIFFFSQRNFTEIKLVYRYSHKLLWLQQLTDDVVDEVCSDSADLAVAVGLRNKKSSAVAHSADSIGRKNFPLVTRFLANSVFWPHPSFRSNLPTILSQFTTSDVRHSKPRPAPHCRVLPPGEFNSKIPQTLSVYSQSFMTIA